MMPDKEKVIYGLERALEIMVDPFNDFRFAGYDGPIVLLNEPIVRDAIALLEKLEPRLMTASDFEDNPDVDSGGFLPCWVECNGIEVAQAISLGVIQEGETLDGWTEVSMAELIPTDPSYNPNVRHWTARPSEEQRSATPW